MADKKPVVIGGLPHKAMLVAALGQTTPAPGDMSARLQELVQRVSGICTNEDAARWCLGFVVQYGESISAALSALPAAGEPVGEVIEGFTDAMGGAAHVVRWYGREPKLGTKLCTTPQPSAAEGVRGEVVCNACGYPEWVCDAIACGKIKQGSTFVADESTDAAEELGPHPLNICPKCKDYYMECDCPADAAVGAQGDGWWEGLGYTRVSGIECVVWQHTTTGERVFADKGRHAEVDALLKSRPTAPAAGKGFEKWWHENCDKFDRGRDLAIAAWQAASSGKGVDDANNRACIRFVADDGSTHASPEAADRHNALTRQPVAGDEWQTIHVKGWDDFIGALERADRKGYMPDALREKWDAFDYRTAPAATPTDGGEG